jgi:hypothetical protein
MITTTTAMKIDSLKTRLKETWMAGDYDRFSRYMEQGARIFYEQLDIPAGCQSLWSSPQNISRLSANCPGRPDKRIADNH